ncbi:MAG: DUF21 domain-containing protein [Candidatus Nealsonbacteria bacterium]|nr:DUF21 domain-containing protein [Candidatus Nealsonbacteria bacterium]
MIGALTLAIAGILLSAFFSGSETGFYRATRVRLVLDALGGDWVARGLVWLTNRPLLFVATTLVGNNLANYLTSLAIVIAVADRMGDVPAAELIVPLALAPVLFVYGELLPKSLFLQAPNRLLRRGGPLMLGFVVLFLPVSLALTGLNRLLASFVGKSSGQVRLTLARHELQGILEEGHEAGILYPVQRSLARGIFAVAKHPVAQFVAPLERLPRARSDMAKAEVLRMAGRYRIAVIPVERSGRSHDLIGYLRVIDLVLDPSDELVPLRQLIEIPAETSHIAALMQMQSAGESLARVVGSGGETLGIVTADRLREPLFLGPHAS